MAAMVDAMPMMRSYTLVNRGVFLYSFAFGAETTFGTNLRAIDRGPRFHLRRTLLSQPL
jgi:hypothetical protein